MTIRERIAKRISPGLQNKEDLTRAVSDALDFQKKNFDLAVKDMVTKEVRSKMSQLPVTAYYDPNNEGYRRVSGDQQRRDLEAVDQDKMFEIAYFMYDTSAMTKRLVDLRRQFIFGDAIKIECDDEAVKDVIDNFCNDSQNKIKNKFPQYMSWLSYLGESFLVPIVNRENGAVKIHYKDPSIIKYVSGFSDVAISVGMQSVFGKKGKTYKIIKENNNITSDNYGLLEGECFFFTTNHPPNSLRGRSDFLTLFDWIDGFERANFQYLERVEHIFNFIWDITLKGYNDDQVRDFVRNNPPPKPNSIRAHNEYAKWECVSPNINAADLTTGLNMILGFICGSLGLPTNWYGSGGKVYQS